MIDAALCSLFMAFGTFSWHFFFAESPDFDEALDYSLIQTVAVFTYQFIWVNK